MDLNTVSEVLIARDRSVLAQWRDGDAWLSGGTALFAEPNPQLSRLIDLAGFGWPALTPLPDGSLEIAATCTLAELAAFAGPPLFGQCCRALLGSFKIQRMATVGGNICSALPAGPMTSLAAALDGQCLIWTSDGGERTVPALDFVLGPQLSCLGPGELLRSITLPAQPLQARTAFRQLSLSELGRSASLVIGRRHRTAGVDGFVLTVTAATPRPMQLRFAAMPTATELQQRLAATVTEYYDDVHGAPRWRKHITELLVEQVRDELAR